VALDGGGARKMYRMLLGKPERKKTTWKAWVWMGG